MERYGGWVKREVLKNRKRPIEALNNRVFMQEQVSLGHICQASSVSVSMRALPCHRLAKFSQLSSMRTNLSLG